MLNSAEHEIYLLIHVKMPTIVGNCWPIDIYEQVNSILDLSEPENAEFLDIFILMST